MPDKETNGESVEATELQHLNSDKNDENENVVEMDFPEKVCRCGDFNGELRLN